MSLSQGSAFPTFCHIEQYGDAGYQAIPRMMAMSKPLNLWAPTSVHFTTEGTRIKVKDFLQYVESRNIRVMGREPWILDPSFRDPVRWPEVEWNKQFDGVLKRICEEDSSLPTQERRVLACPPEAGWEWADRYLATRPEEAARWSRVVKGRSSRIKVPSEIRARAEAYGSDSFLIARQILRDAYNHGQAYTDSGAEVPFLISPTDKEYLRILATAPSENSLPSINSTPITSGAVDIRMVDIANQLVELLRILDIQSVNHANPDSLAKFMRGEGHHLLITWISSVCAILRRTDPRAVDGLVLQLLRDDLGRAKLAGPIQEFLQSKDEAAVGLVGVVSMAAGLATDPIGIMSALGVLAQVYPIGKGLTRQLGFVPSEFTGEQWPFLYTYGRKATRKTLARLQFVLDQAR